MSEGFLTQEEIDALLGKKSEGQKNPEEEGSASGSPAAEKDTEKGKETINGLELILDFPLKISVRLGEVRKPLQEIRRLTPGKVLELDSFIKDPVDILIDGKLIARGEVIVIDENFGVKITQIIDPVERIKKLR